MPSASEVSPEEETFRRHRLWPAPQRRLSAVTRARSRIGIFRSARMISPASVYQLPEAPPPPDEPPPPEKLSEEPDEPDAGRPVGYRPELTPVGRLHPIFRFSPDEKESAEIWNRLREMFWCATGYEPKRAAEVLAVHPKLGSGGKRANKQSDSGRKNTRLHGRL